MPTEHEYKYLLDIEIASTLTGLPQIVIRQGYLAISDSMDLRVRHSILENGDDKWRLTFKQKVVGRKVEIEQIISPRDGMDLWNVADSKLKKIRYCVENKNRTTWEIDLFYNHNVGDLYFAMAEIELKEGSPPPEELPDFLQKFLLFKVPLTDDRFLNKRLGDMGYAKNLYTEIRGAINDISHEEKDEEKSV